jgi:hypothetical protein
MTTTDVPDDDLVALLRGDLGRRGLGDVVAHLRGCDRCRLRLVEVAQVHGSLEAAARLLREPTGVTHRPSVPAPTLPPLAPRRLRRTTSRWVAAAAAVVVASGAGGVALTRHQRGSSSALASASVASVRLAPLTGSGAGRVTMRAEPPTPTGGLTTMTVSTQGLPRPASGDFYYAWLLDPATKKMLPLGVVDASRGSTFEVSADLVGRYHAVDISLQSDDGDPAHSATSVLRGAY